jgi:hypothetical protein
VKAPVSSRFEHNVKAKKKRRAARRMARKSSQKNRNR